MPTRWTLSSSARRSAPWTRRGRDDGQAGDRPLIVKTKRFAMRPMFEEDAMAQMEELGHAFFVFLNAESESVAVLYRRRDGSFGLIEPVLDNGRPR